MEIPAKIQIKHLGNLERIHRQNLKFIDQADVRGVWILRAPGVGKIHFARQVLVAEGYYPTLNNKWWDGYQSQKVVIMEDVDRKRSSSFTTTLRFGVLGEAMVLGFGRGRGRRPFLEPVFLPGTAAPSVLQGALFRSERFIGRCEVSSWKFPPKFKLSTWAIWSAFTAKISNSSTKQMCAESGFCARSRSRQDPLCPPSAGSRIYYPTLNNKWWDGYQSQKVVIMEDVDKKTVKFLHHHLKIWGFGRSPMVLGFGRG